MSTENQQPPVTTEENSNSHPVEKTESLSATPSEQKINPSLPNTPQHNPANQKHYHSNQHNNHHNNNNYNNGQPRQPYQKRHYNNNGNSNYQKGYYQPNQQYQAQYIAPAGFTPQAPFVPVNYPTTDFQPYLPQQRPPLQQREYKQSNTHTSPKQTFAQPLSPVKKKTPLVIKTKEGAIVDLKSHAKKSSISGGIPSAIVTANTTAATTEAAEKKEESPATENNIEEPVKSESPAPDATPSATASAAPKFDAKASFLEQVRLRKLERERAKAEAAAAAAAAAAPPVAEKTEPAPAPAPAPAPVAENAPSTPVTEEKTEEPKSAEPESTPAQPQQVSEESQPAEESSAPVVAEQPTAEVAEESTTVSEPVEELPSFTISNFLEMVQNASVIENVFDFKYPEPFQAVDESLKTSKLMKYNPGFLVQFAEPLKYAIDPEFKENILSKINLTKAEPRGSSSKGKEFRSKSGPRGPMRGADFDRNNSKNGSRRKDRNDKRDKSRRGDREGSRKPRNPKSDESKEDEKPQIKLAPEDVKPLEKSAKRWVPKSQKKAKEVKYAPDGVTVLYDDEDLSAKVRSLLNKLSLEKFDAISSELIELANQSKWETDAASLSRVIQLTFGKATDEPHWSGMYAKFCQVLIRDTDDSISSTDFPSSKEGEEFMHGTTLSYNILLRRCQSEFEKGWSNDLPTNEDGTPLEPELMSDEYYILAAQKRRGLGLVRFVGELFSLNLVSARVIGICMKNLLPVDKPDDYVPAEDTLESIAQLATTVGQLLSQRNPSMAAGLFTFVKRFSEDENIISRLRFRFLDIVEASKKDWNSLVQSGPKTLSEIHQDFAQKKKQSSRENERSRSKKDSKWGQNSRVDLSKLGGIRRTANLNSSRNEGSNRARSNHPPVTQDSFQTVRSKAPSRSASTASIVQPEETESRQNSKNIFALLNDEESENEEEDEASNETEENDEESQQEADQEEQQPEEVVPAAAEETAEEPVA